MNKIAPIQSDQTACNMQIQPSIFTKKRSKDEPLKICKICLEEEIVDEEILGEMTTLEHRDNQMVVPCECSGSMGNVHQKCIKMWIQKQLASADTKKTQCEICKSPLFFKMEKNKYCDCKLKNLKQVSLCNVICAIVEVTLIVMAVMTFRYSEMVHESSFLKYVLIILIVVLVLIFLTTFAVMISQAFVRVTKIIGRVYSIRQCEHLGLREARTFSSRHIGSNKKIKSQKRIGNSIIIQPSASPTNA